MANWIYVDNSNVIAEGQRVSAVQQDGTLDDKDFSYRINFGKLYQFIARSDPETARAVLFGSRPPPNDALWDMAKHAGFEVIIHDRNAANKEKMIDTHLTAEMIDDSHKASPGDTFTIVSGDADYVPPVEKLIGRGFQVNVVFWDHAAARVLRQACSKFISLDPHLDNLGFRSPRL